MKMIPMVLRSRWTRRAWLQATTRSALHATVLGSITPTVRWRTPPRQHTGASVVGASVACVDPKPLYALAQRAVDAARSRGASYADARLTRVVLHTYGMMGNGVFWRDEELLGVGVRVLANGYWGFAASPRWDADDVTRLAVNAVAQAQANALGARRAIELATTPAVTGTWTTPIRVDPFSISIEEKLDHIMYWKACATQAGIPFRQDGMGSNLSFARQECVLATSEGTLIAQTRHETGGVMEVAIQAADGRSSPSMFVHGIDVAGKGWELFLDANPEAQFPKLLDELRRQPAVSTKEAEVGRYTLVCDGATMATILDATLGTATQLDRALGYEANASGTSYLTDPLGMIGTMAVASPLVTITANRSAPAQLATVQWDDEGVAPARATLVTSGILTDFQTTREQATWLAPYYAKAGRPVRSNGHAGAEGALDITLQQMPNLALTPNATDLDTNALLANVRDGIFVTGGSVKCDFQGRAGVIFGTMREIKSGRLGRFIAGGGISFNALDFWKHVSALGGPSSAGHFQVSQYGANVDDEKGEPAQRTSHSVVAPAATIDNQTVINPWRKA
jgi:TldD protein